MVELQTEGNTRAVFLSYASQDAEAAKRVCEALRAAEIEVWFDQSELRGGDAWDAAIRRQVKDCTLFIALVSQNTDARSEGYFRREWHLAILRMTDMAEDRTFLLPVVIDNTAESTARVPERFRERQWTRIPAGVAPPEFTDQVRRLLGDSHTLSSPPPAASSKAQIGAAFQAGAVPRNDISAPSTPSRLSICVLPFANMSADPEQEYFADGISEDIITDLSKVSALSVIARNSAFAFKGKHIDVLQVARQLKVSHVLEGSVRKAGKRVRITAQLINGATNDHLWAERWDRDLDDIFALQDEMSQAIVAALKLKLLPGEKRLIEHRGTTSLEAYDKFLRGRALLHSGVTAADIRLGIEEFRQALFIDPDFMEVYGDIAYAYIWYNAFAPHARPQSMAELEVLAGEAIARAPHHWAAQLAKGVLLLSHGDWAGAAAASANAKASGPPSNTSLAILLSQSLATMGRIKESLKVAEAARTVDPLSPQVSSSVQDALYIIGLTDEARVEYERALALAGWREPREHTALQQIWDTGDMQRTRAQFRRFVDHQTLRTPVLAKILDVIDQPAAALGLVRDAFGDPANQDGARMMILAWYAARFGDDELAVAALRRAFLEYGGTYPTAIWYPCLSRARRTPAFKTFAHDCGLDRYWRASGNWGEFARPVGDDDFEIIR